MQKPQGPARSFLAPSQTPWSRDFFCGGPSWLLFFFGSHLLAVCLFGNGTGIGTHVWGYQMGALRRDLGTPIQSHRRTTKELDLANKQMILIRRGLKSLIFVCGVIAWLLAANLVVDIMRLLIQL